MAGVWVVSDVWMTKYDGWRMRDGCMMDGGWMLECQYFMGDGCTTDVLCFGDGW